MASQSESNKSRGREMKRRRIATGLSAQQLGEALGMTGDTARTSVYRAESGCHKIGASRWKLFEIVCPNGKRGPNDHRKEAKP